MNTSFTAALESTYKPNSTYPNRNTEKLIEKISFVKTILFFVDKKAFNETDILMRSYNPSLSGDYFLFEKKKFLFFTLFPSFDQF